MSLKWGFKGIRELSTWIVGSRASGRGNNLSSLIGMEIFYT